MADAKRVAAGRRSRNKGKTFERDIVNRIKERGLDAKRGWWQAKGGAEVPDVVLVGFWLELSTGAAVNPLGKLKQAEENNGTDAIPVAITRTKGSRTIDVTMRLSSLIKLTIAREITCEAPSLVVTIDFDAFLDAVTAWYGRDSQRVTATEPPATPPVPTVSKDDVTYRRGVADGRRGHPPAEVGAVYLRGYSDGCDQQPVTSRE